MLDIKFIADNLEAVKNAACLKRKKIDFDRLLELYKNKKAVQAEIDARRAERNDLSKAGQGSKLSPELIEEGKRLKDKINELEKQLLELDEEFAVLIAQVPNIISEDTPAGADENDNLVLRTWGEPKKFDFAPRGHMALGILNNIIETDKSSVISGARFNYLFNEAVLLQFALLKMVFDVLTDPVTIKKLADSSGSPFDKPFTPVLPPVMAKSAIMKKMDRFEPLEDRYHLEADDVLLVGSAEHTLGPLHLGEIIPEEELPIRYIGYSTAFRREAGSYGKDTAGILRRHQFDKAEMETFVQPEHGLAEQNLIVAIQEHLVRKLGLPYRVMSICSGDMGKPDYRQIDIECWIPSQNKYRETHTADYMTDYQARRLNIRYRSKSGVKNYVHMNDATAFAMGRMLIAIIENYQNPDGSITVPEILRKYVGKDRIAKK